jgi:integrase
MECYFFCLPGAYPKKKVKMKFTKTSVEGLKLPNAGERYLVWDSELPGFGLRVTPSGIMYIAQARVGGTSRRVSLGRHGVLTLHEARTRARKELSAMLEGKDPVVRKKREAAYLKTLRELADAYIKDHRDLKASSIADINKHVDRNFATWRDKPVIEITRDRVAVKFRELSDRGPAQANQAFRILRALLNYARAAFRPEGKPLLVENPVDILSQTKVWNRVRPRSGRIPTEKIGEAWNLLQILRADEWSTDIGRTAADVTCFLLLTGARWSEAAELTWDRVDLEGRTWYLPDPKNRNPVTFPLSDAAVAILAARNQDGPFVFPGWGKAGRIAEIRGTLGKVSEAIGVRITAHDFRRTFRAIAAECQIELWRTKLLMGHKLSGDVTLSAYTEKENLSYLAGEINQVAEWITAKALEAASEKVVSIRAAG